MTYRDGVFDITKFVQNHPGGLERSLGLGTDVGGETSWLGWVACTEPS